MCYQNCQHEIIGGERWGDCRLSFKQRENVCPDNFCPECEEKHKNCECVEDER